VFITPFSYTVIFVYPFLKQQTSCQEGHVETFSSLFLARVFPLEEKVAEAKTPSV